MTDEEHAGIPSEVPHPANADPVPHLAPLPAEGSALIKEAIEECFLGDPDIEDILPRLRQRLRDVNANGLGAAPESIQTALTALWNLFEGINAVRKDANIARARDLLAVAAQGFRSVEEDELTDLAVALGASYEAVTEAQSYNFGRAQQLLSQSKEYLQGAGQFRDQAELLIDHMQPDALFLAAMRALLDGDFSQARPLVEKASQAAEQLANDYYEKGSSEYQTFMGFSRLYVAYYSYFRANSDFNLFQYDELAKKSDLSDDAVQAREYLSNGDARNQMVVNASYIAGALAELLELLPALARLMQQLFHSTLKSDTPALHDARARIQRASAWAAKAGPQNAAFIRSCDQLLVRINNLERLAKPTRKDFGAYSGLVACGVFLPLFLIVSGANFFLETGIEASVLLYSCLALALIGGFGFGALRFKSLFVQS